MTFNKKTLTYCSNIFKTNNIKKLKKYIKTYLNTKEYKHTHINLCVSNQFIKKISNKIKNIKKWQNTNKLNINSFNGFVYQNFHLKNIKEKIYYPDWSSKKRLDFTQKIIKTSDILNVKKNISISTLPLSYKKWIQSKHIIYILYKFKHQICAMIKHLKKNKNYIHIDLEPEPYCIIENYHTIKKFYIKVINKKNKKHICLCYDICHFSVNFEKHEKIIKHMKNLIHIGKIQVSSALSVILPVNPRIIKRLKNTLFILNKSNFLHQCVIKKNLIIKKVSDVKYVIKNISINNDKEIKIHCHIPIYKKKFGHMYTTQKETKKVLNFIQQQNITKHIEIESYTHHTLFKKISCQKSITKELFLTKTHIIK